MSKAAIYIHIPFCKVKCVYCDFYSITKKENQIPLFTDSLIKEIETYIGHTALNLLDEWGYDMALYTMFFTEFWVQEFAKQGGGHHSTHVHWDNHISGFYFLKCSDKTS